MKTNDIFNFRRFGKYFASDFRTCTANYGLSLMTISLLMLATLYMGGVIVTLIFNNEWDGPDMGARGFTFAIAMICMIVTMPVKCYGRITEKQYGSFWLSIPASKLEKCLSMIIMTSVIVPVTGAILYLGLDSIICALDSTCGKSLISGIIGLVNNLNEISNEFGNLSINLGTSKISVEDSAQASRIIEQMTSPWLYIDDLFGMTLPFLLGAVFFKSGKSVKTFLAIFAVSTALSIAVTPLMTSYISNVISIGVNEEEALSELINNGFFKNLALIDSISDTVVNLALLIGIWFRIKTLKH